MEGLKNTLKEQDKKIENLKEKVYILESQVRREPVLYVSVLVHAGVCVCLQVSDVLPRVYTLVHACVPVWLWLYLCVIAFDYVRVSVYKHMYPGVYACICSVHVSTMHEKL